MNTCVVAVVAATILAWPWPGAAAGGAPVQVTCAGQVATIVGTESADALLGTGGDDVIAALGGPDLIRGRGGHDLICGGARTDTIHGGPDGDTVLGGLGSDHVSGGGGSDHIDGGHGNLAASADAGNDHYEGDGELQLDFGASPRGVTVDLLAGTAHGWGDDTLVANPGIKNFLVGSRYDDTLLGTDAVDSIDGAPGAHSLDSDVVDGRGGTDYLSARAGTVEGGDGDDELDTSGVSDLPISLSGGPGNDDIGAAGHPAAILSGGPGNDYLLWHVGSVSPTEAGSMDGGEGQDALLIGDAFTTASSVVADLAKGTVSFNASERQFTGVEQLAFFQTVAGPDTGITLEIDGSDGDDHVAVHPMSVPVAVHASLLAGDDILTTGPGDDTIDMGEGNDTVDAGGGSDACFSAETTVRCETVDP